MKYDKYEFTGEITGQGYMLVDMSSGVPIEAGYRDLLGNIIDVSDKIYEAHLLERNAAIPEWAK